MGAESRDERDAKRLEMLLSAHIRLSQRLKNELDVALGRNPECTDQNVEKVFAGKNAQHIFCGSSERSRYNPLVVIIKLSNVWHRSQQVHSRNQIITGAICIHCSPSAPMAQI